MIKSFNKLIQVRLLSYNLKGYLIQGLIIILIIFFSACSREKPKEIFIIPSDSIVFNLSFLASDIEYIPLQTPEDFAFTTIFKIVARLDKIYINAGKDLICFDNKGQFLFNLSDSIGRIIKDSGFIFDFDLSSDEKTLAILLFDRILIYNFSGDKFVFSKSVVLKKPWPESIDLVPGTTNILLSIYPRIGSEQTLSILINEDGDTLNSKANLFKYKMPYYFGAGVIRYKTKDDLCFKEWFSDTCFCINSQYNDFVPKLILNSQGRTYLQMIKGEGAYVNPEFTEFIYVTNIFETPGYLFYDYSYSYPDVNFTINRKIIFDRLRNKMFEIALYNDLKEDLCGGPDFYPTSVNGEKLYSWIYAFSLKDYISSESFIDAKVSNKEKRENLKELADSLEVLDNPVLIKVSSKK